MDAFDSSRPLPGVNPSDRDPDDPGHSPAWRWHRARWLLETHGRASARIDDHDVRRARDFQVAMARPDAAPGKRRPARPDPAIAAALELADGGDPLRRGELEAYLLTDEPFHAIAARLGLAPEVVAGYHALFFAVRDCPFARDWIATKAVGCGPWNDYAGPHPVGAWKYGAYSGGVRLLELLIAITTGRPFPAWIREACGKHADEHESRMRLLGATTVAMMMAKCRSQVEKLLEVREQLDRLEARKREADMEAMMARVAPTFRAMMTELAGSGEPSTGLPPGVQEPDPPAAPKRRRNPRPGPSSSGPSSPGGEHVAR